MKGSKLTALHALAKELRSPSGCAWTRKQHFESLVPKTIEESYELLDSVQRNNIDEIKSELGDLLYHVMLYAAIAEEQDLFSLEDIANVMLQKHQERMPSEEARQSLDAEQTNQYWQRSKIKRRQQSGESILTDIQETLPALLQAHKLQERAADVGFDWSSIAPVFEKIQEELIEVQDEIQGENRQAQLQEEIGDLLFSCINLARHLTFNAEVCLHHANKKFINRFQFIEKELAKMNKDIHTASLEEMETLWQQSKNRK